MIAESTSSARVTMRRDASGFMVRDNPQVAAMARAFGDWPDRTVADVARERTAAAPDRVMLVDQDRALTAGELYDSAARLAGYFGASGLVAGDVVAFQLPNWWEAHVVNLAAAMTGLVVNPIVPFNRDAEVTLMLNVGRAKCVFVPPVFRKFDYPAMMARIAPDLSHRPRVIVVRGDGDGDDDDGDDGFDRIVASASPLAEPRPVDPDAVKLLLFTSGTTGRPKGVLHTHNSIHADGMKMVPALGLGQDDVTFSPSPVTHVSGYLWALNHPWLADIPAVMIDVWDAARAFDLAERHGCSFMLGATPFLRDMVAEVARRGRTLPRLRQYLCGGAAVPPQLIRDAAAVFPNCIPWRNFGASEALTMTRGPERREDVAFGAETDGRLHHCDVRIVDLADGTPLPAGADGEILVREPSMAVGYADTADNADAYDADGFFRMGDIGRIVHGDHVLVTGRQKDLIIRSGENISAKEIEDALLASGLVADVAVVAAPDAVTGEAICAVLVPGPGGAPTIDAVTAAIAAAGLARQKTPERLVVVAELPRTASGKVRKDMLRAQLRDRADVEQAA